MLRRALLLVPAVVFAADPHQDIVRLLAAAVSGMSEGEPERFLRVFDPSMPRFREFEAAVRALLAQNEVSSSVEFQRDEGDNQARELELDWTLQIRTLQNTGPFAQRRELIRCRLTRQKKGWKIVSISPLEFFAPQRFAPQRFAPQRFAPQR